MWQSSKQIATNRQGKSKVWRKHPISVQKKREGPELEILLEGLNVQRKKNIFFRQDRAVKVWLLTAKVCRDSSLLHQLFPNEKLV